MAYSELPWRPFLGHQAWSWTTLRRGNVFYYVYRRFLFWSRFFSFFNVFYFYLQTFFTSMVSGEVRVVSKDSNVVGLPTILDWGQIVSWSRRWCELVLIVCVLWLWRRLMIFTLRSVTSQLRFSTSSGQYSTASVCSALAALQVVPTLSVCHRRHRIYLPYRNQTQNTEIKQCK